MQNQNIWIKSDSIVEFLNWFQREQRDLPWRIKSSNPENLRDPYRVWISEIMLQQTTVVAVISYFEQWMTAFPSLKDLAKASEEKVLEMWSGLGYYSRARNIQKCAKILMKEYGGEFPRTRSELLKLPGIGEYTAGALLSLAMGQNEAILDGNLIRIFSRIYGFDFLPTNKENSEIYWQIAQQWVNRGAPQLINEALMEWGAKGCTVKKPLCSECTFSNDCVAYKTHKQNELPPLKKKTPWVFVELRAELLFRYRGESKEWALIRPHNQRFLNGLLGFPLIEHEKSVRSDLDLSFNVVKHTITHHKISIEIYESESTENQILDSVIWCEEKDVVKSLGSSLAKKIWNKKLSKPN